MSILPKVILLFVVYVFFAIVLESTKEIKSYGKEPFNLNLLQTDGQAEKEADAIFRKGIQLYYNGFIERGNILMDSAYTVYSNKIYLRQKASNNLRLGQYGEAMESLDKAIDDGFETIIGYRAWVKMIYLHNYREAITDFENYEAQSPEPSFSFAMSATMLAGVAHKQLADYPKAVSVLSEYIELFEAESKAKVDVYAYWYRGMSHYEMKEYNSATADLDTFISRYANGPEAHFGKGKVLLALGDTTAACTEFQLSKDLVIKGYKRAYIWHELPDQLYLEDIDDQLSWVCNKNLE